MCRKKDACIKTPIDGARHHLIGTTKLMIPHMGNSRIFSDEIIYMTVASVAIFDDNLNVLTGGKKPGAARDHRTCLEPKKAQK
jgi:hypothetical protein